MAEEQSSHNGFTLTNSLCLPLIIWRALVTARSQDALVGTWLRLMMVVCRLDLFTSTEQGDICTKHKRLLSSRWQNQDGKNVHLLQQWLDIFNSLVPCPRKWIVPCDGCCKDRALLKLIELNLHHSSDTSKNSEHYFSRKLRALIQCPIPFHGSTSSLLTYYWQTNLLEEQWSKMSHIPPIRPKHRSSHRTGWHHMHESGDSPLKEIFIDRQICKHNKSTWDEFSIDHTKCTIFRK